jgi:4-amino-4-deoxy-L-arabinose transferase-like glycosyltransferase
MVAPTATAFLRKRSVALLLLLVLTIYGFEAHARRREKSAPAVLGDQNAYLGYARHLYESNYTVIEDRNRMPVYPFLLSLTYRPGMTEGEFLVRAQTFTVNLSIVLLFLLFLIFRRFFPPLHSLAMLAATAFGVFLYRAERAQVEPLFYFVSFCAFVLFLRMFAQPQWWLALLAGAVTGLAHLTKASVLPALVLWAVVFAAEPLWAIRSNHWRRLALLALVLAAFLAVVFPYIQTSKRIYDAYFYNVNSTFVIWCDSSTEGYEFLSAYGDKDQWRALPAEQLPSFRKYWREHSMGQMVGRIAHGALDLLTQNARAIGYYKFVIALLVAGAILCVRQRQRAREFLAAHSFAAIFCLLFFAGYFLLYAWYDKIINDSRFILSIFLPFLFTSAILVLRLGRGRVVWLANRQMAFEEFFPFLLLGLALIDVVYNAPSLFR